MLYGHVLCKQRLQILIKTFSGLGIGYGTNFTAQGVGTVVAIALANFPKEIY